MSIQLPVDSQKKKLGFQQILLDVKESIRECHTFGGVVNKILTFNDRLLLRLGFKSLSAPQRAILEALKDREDFVLSEQPDAPSAVTFGIRSYGRIILGSEPSTWDGDLIFGHVPVDGRESDHIATATALASRKVADDVVKINQYFSSLTAPQVREVVNTVEFMVDHIDPVLIYVNQETFSVFSKHNNLLDKRGGGERYLFERLRNKPFLEWGDCEKTFVYCMYWLRQAGARGEEFNGLQLDLDELQCYLSRATQTLNAARASQTPAPDDSVAERAAYLNKQKSGVREEFIIYRTINGLTFHKEERLLRKTEVAANAGNLPERVTQYLTHVWDMTPDRYPTLYDMFYDWFAKSTFSRGNLYPEKFMPAEEMMHVIVANAVKELRADIGMTRCIREIARIKIINDASMYEEACCWPTSDFYCCVVPSEELAAAVRDSGVAPLPVVLTAVAKRMEYNSWHYLPGHFSPEIVPEGRHFYFPPAMPDLAEWANQHHAGHMLANVLHCIRSPGGLTYAGRGFPGFFDIRLMRQAGEPFTLEDLKRAIVYTSYLKEFYQAMLDYVCSRGVAFKVTAFTKSWYEEHYKN
jgi:hypothetical protein